MQDQLRLVVQARAAFALRFAQRLAQHCVIESRVAPKRCVASWRQYGLYRGELHVGERAARELGTGRLLGRFGINVRCGLCGLIIDAGGIGCASVIS